MIASDGGLLSEPLELTRLQMAPGERTEILIDFSDMIGQSFSLMSYASEFPNGIYGATNPGMNSSMVLNGYNPNPLNGNDFNIMSFQVITATDNPVTEIPATLVEVMPIPEANSNITRTLTMTPENMGMNQLNGNFLINNASFDMDVINYSIPEGNTEIWSIRNQSAIAHPFHIHDVQFYILDRNGNTPPPSEQGRKDVILIKTQETIRFIAKFDDFGGDPVPFMYHCHMLIHEDGGMMGQFVVKKQGVGISEFNLNDNVLVYPNPSNGIIYLETKNGFALIAMEVVDVYGRSIKTFTDLSATESIDLSMLAKGVYFLRFKSDEGEAIQKIILE